MFVKWKDIDFTYDNFNLKLNLEIKKGELVTLLGPSGCGKTTALRIAAGFIKPDSGEFIIDDHNMTNIRASDRNIGIVFQNYALFPHLNVEQNIEYGLRNKKLSKSVIKDEVEYILKSLHLENYNKRGISSLSGGEKQRVALGRSLAIKPRLLLLDEPLSALDADLRKKLRYEIKAIQREFKITTLYITHDQEEALAVSDRIAILKDGRLQQYSNVNEIYMNPKNKFVANFIGEINCIIIENKEYYFRPESLKEGHSDDSLNFIGNITNIEYQGLYSRGILNTNCNNRVKVISFNHLYSNKYHVPLSKVISFK